MSQQSAINAATPLRALRGLVLDTETTGLRVERDRLISLGAVRFDGAEPEADGELAFLVDPGQPIPAVSTAIHGLSDSDVAGAGRFADHAATLAAAIDGRAVIGHNIGFDLAILAHEHERAGLPWVPPPSLDTGLLAQALNPHLPDASLETIADWLNVTISERHSALGDARTTARIYLALLPRLRDAGVQTFGEAERFMTADNAEAVRRHAVAGWHLQRLAGARAEPAMDTFAYRHSLAELMSSPVIGVAGEATLADALARMNEAGISAILVGDHADTAGIVTERDVVSQLARFGSEALDRPVADIMTSPVEALAMHEPAYRAVGRLQRLGIRHIAVTDAEGRIVGVVSARDLLRRSASAALVLGDEIAAAGTVAEMARAFAQVPAAARKLRGEDLAPLRIAGLISAEVRALTARAAQLAAADMEPAPAAWSLLVLGSAGRGESLLVPDQDNALICEDRPGMADWAARFGQRVNEILDEAGLPLCKGGVMAGRPDWRHTPAQWRARVAGWIDHARPQDLLNVDIFFDLRHAAGATPLTEALRTEALSMAQKSPAFIRALNSSIAQMTPPIGPFGRLRTREGRLDIKAGGLLPIVALARAVALRHGLAERATATRLAAAAEKQALPAGDAARLAEMQRDFVALAMDQQLADIAAGVSPSYGIELRRLDRRARKALAGQLGDLDAILTLAWSTLSG